MWEYLMTFAPNYWKRREKKIIWIKHTNEQMIMSSTNDEHKPSGRNEFHFIPWLNIRTVSVVQFDCCVFIPTFLADVLIKSDQLSRCTRIELSGVAARAEPSRSLIFSIRFQFSYNLFSFEIPTISLHTHLLAISIWCVWMNTKWTLTGWWK